MSSLTSWLLRLCAAGSMALVAQDAPREVPEVSAVQTVRLENGLSVVWQHHAVPPGRCSLRLVVHVGSLEEAPEELGMAHFVEHMAFAGTRRFAADSVYDWIRSRGMAPGRHANAHTSLASTTYEIDLPSNDAASLRDALDVLTQFATAVLFEEHAVERERAIVEAEERERTSAAATAERQLFERMNVGALAAERWPIGNAELRAGFTAERLRAFHAKWYRPDNMTLVLAGDLGQHDVAAVCAAVFGAIPAPSVPMPERADRGCPAPGDSPIVIEQADLDRVEFRVLCPLGSRWQPRTEGHWHRRMLLHAIGACAEGALYRQWQSLMGPMQELRVRPAGGELFQQIEGIVCQWHANPDDAAASLRACARAVAFLREHGVAPADVTAARQADVAMFANTFREAAFTPAREVADRLARDAATGGVRTDPALLQRLGKRSWDSLEAGGFVAEFRAWWPLWQPTIAVLVPPGFTIDARSIWDAAHAELVAVAPSPSTLLTEPGPSWPYAASREGDAPLPSTRGHEPELDVNDLHFANGVRLLVRSSHAAADEVRVTVAIGGGMSSTSGPWAPAAFLFERALPNLGYGKASADEVGRTVATLSARMSGWFEPRCFQLDGSSNRADLAFLLEWMAARVADTVCDDTTLMRAALDAVPALTRFRDSPNGLFVSVLGDLVGAELLPSIERLTALEGAEVRDFMATQWQTAPLTLVVVGDVEVADAVALVARTFGCLSQRDAALPPATAATIEKGRREERVAPTGDTEARICMFAPLSIAAMSGPGWSVQLLEQILHERIDASVREQLGASYHPQLTLYEIPVAKRTGGFWIGLRIVPSDIGRAEAALLAVLESLRTNGVGHAELEAARKILANSFAEGLATNQGWASRLVRAHYLPDALERLRLSPARLQAVDAAQVSELAKECFAPERLTTLVLRPER